VTGQLCPSVLIISEIQDEARGKIMELTPVNEMNFDFIISIIIVFS
jgi:hypothetical protein